MSTITPPSRTNLVEKLLITYICLPFIKSFFKAVVDDSSETLVLEVPVVNFSAKYGGRKNLNNNQSGRPIRLIIFYPVHFVWRMMLDPKLGLGETYMDGDWQAEPNPTHLLNLLIRAKKETSVSRSAKQTTVFSSAKALMTECVLSLVRKVAAVVTYIQHRFRDNTISQSAKNVEDHYDLGNDMFKLFLDKSMTYSCGIFQDVDTPVDTVDFEVLEKAQIKKIDDLVEMMKLSENDRVLEIGCGWGAFAIRAVQQHSCEWTGLTISHEQLAFGMEKVREAKLEKKIDLKYQDYRLATGEFSRIVSVEMIEAVGEKFLPQYFQMISDRLAPGGKAVLQAIVCPDAYYERYCRSSDFIKKYIFPGGHMPSIGAIKECLPADMKFGEKRHIGAHYAKTLDHWYSAWTLRYPDLKALGISDSFHRRWQFYFALCSSLFDNGHIDVIQFEADKAAV